jgi:dethiobiotin synthetase
MQGFKMKAIFVTGTDTGSGKSIVAGLLAEYLAFKGKSVITQKWVATGSGDDIRTHRKIMGTVSFKLKKVLTPYRFKLAASPHLAAYYERRPIKKDKIKNAFLMLSKRYEIVIVEGTGGVLAPISRKNFLIDIVRDLNLPVLLVSHNRLGAINHTLLSIEALKNRGIKIIGVVFNNLSRAKKIILEDNQKIVQEISGIKVLGVLHKSASIDTLKEQFKIIGDKIVL